MISDNEIVKLILGFKVRMLRLRSKTSYQEISNATGLSVSYLNDIEKGKKYPKPDKIAKLAKVFDMEYDELVSTRSDKKLQPVVELLNSDFFKYFPLEEFGVSLEKLIDVFSSSPDRFSAIISTILKMARSYQIEKEQFYRIALRSYQDIHDNYFPDIELAASKFRKEHKINGRSPMSADDMADVLHQHYDIVIDRVSLGKEEKLRAFRSYFHPEKKVLFLNKGLSEGQERFILSKELGFQYMRIIDRPLETQLNKEASFDKLLGNFKASYFSAALLMDEEEIRKDVERMARAADWSPDLMTILLKKYQVTPETLLQRFTNILPHFFDLKDLFFIRLDSTADLIQYHISKELHLSQLHTPYNNELNEHLCHRWVSISSIKNIRSQKVDYLINAQISEYWQTNKSYFCISIAQPDGFNNAGATSVTLGLMMTEKLKGTFNFIKDPEIKLRKVHTTCERCSMPDCDNRVAPPTFVERHNRQIELEAELKKL